MRIGRRLISGLSAPSAPGHDRRSSSADARQQLREWVAQVSGRIRIDELKDDTPLLETRIITSLQLLDLILFIESCSGKPVDVERLKPGLFRDIDTICRSFLETEK